MDNFMIIFVGFLMLTCGTYAKPTPDTTTELLITAEQSAVDESVLKTMSGHTMPEEEKIDIFLDVVRQSHQGDIAIRSERFVEDEGSFLSERLDQYTTTESIPEKEKLLILIQILKVPSDESKDVLMDVRKQRSSDDESNKTKQTQDEVYEEDDSEEDMEMAETIVFRPLFSYRQDSAARRRSSRDVSRPLPMYDYD